MKTCSHPNNLEKKQCAFCCPLENGQCSACSYSTKRHPHADLIIAWANGAKIQWREKEGDKWKDTHPTYALWWLESNQYRIKPEPKPDVVMYTRAKCHPFTHSNLSDWTEVQGVSDTIKATFDGETGKLKKVEMI